MKTYQIRNRFVLKLQVQTAQIFYEILKQQFDNYSFNFDLSGLYITEHQNLLILDNFKIYDLTKIGNKFQQYISMSFHQIKLVEGQINNQSFSHQQSIIQQYQPKHKKKSSIYQNSRIIHKNRVKTQERQSPNFKNQALQSYANSLHLATSNHSVSKVGKKKQKKSINGPPKRPNTEKHTISVINLVKKKEKSKGKGSSTITRRKQSSTEIIQKIKQKIQDFKIISNCLQQYVRQERRNSNQTSINEIIKIIGAFNRSQIGPISKHLQKLISQIVQSIQYSMPQPQLKSILKKSISFESPHHFVQSQDDINNTVKKGIPGKEYLKKQDKDVEKLQQNLGRLQYESKRLKYFLSEISQRGQKQRIESLGQKEKLEELRQLKQIAQSQAKMISFLQQISDDSEGTYRQDSQN